MTKTAITIRRSVKIRFARESFMKEKEALTELSRMRRINKQEDMDQDSQLEDQ